MSLLIGFLTFVMVVNSVLLIFLVLIQLPKKEAGAGLAFGAGTADALFGAGSGNALTKMTKYAATAFLSLTVILSVMNMRYARRGDTLLEDELKRKAQVAPTANIPPSPAAAPAAATTTPAAAPAANTLQTTLPTAAPATATPATPAPVAPATPAAAPATTPPQ